MSGFINLFNSLLRKPQQRNEVGRLETAYSDGQKVHLLQLPEELLLKITDWLTPNSLLRWASSSHFLYQLLNADAVVWNKMYSYNFDLGHRDLVSLLQNEDAGPVWKGLYKEKYILLKSINYRLAVDVNSSSIQKTIQSLWKMTVESKDKNLKRLETQDTGKFILGVLASLFGEGWHRYDWSFQALHVLVALLHIQGYPLSALFKASPIWGVVHDQVNQLNSLSFQPRSGGTHVAMAYMIQAYLMTCLLQPLGPNDMTGYIAPPIGFQTNPDEWQFETDTLDTNVPSEMQSVASSFVSVLDTSFPRRSSDMTRVELYNTHLPSSLNRFFIEAEEDEYVGYYGYLRPDFLHRPMVRTIQSQRVWFDGPMVSRQVPIVTTELDVHPHRFAFAGHDPIDDFTMKGWFSMDGKVNFVKRYTVQGHTWKYEGIMTPFGLAGRWGSDQAVAPAGTGGPFWMWRKSSV
jgi:hypothetical protein